MYTLMAVAGLLVSGVYLCRSARRRGMDDNDAIILGLIVCVGIFVGSHLLYALVNYQTLPALFRQTSWKTAKKSFGNAWETTVTSIR